VRLFHKNCNFSDNSDTYIKKEEQRKEYFSFFFFRSSRFLFIFGLEVRILRTPDPWDSEGFPLKTSFAFCPGSV